MANRYRHTQPGVLTVIVFAVAAIVCGSLALVNPTPAPWLLWAAAIGRRSGLALLLAYHRGERQRSSLAFRPRPLDLPNSARRH